MSEQAKEAMSALLAQITELAQSGITMAHDQIPCVLQQLIIRDRIVYTAGFLVCIVIWAAFIKCLSGACKHGWWDKYSEFTGRGIAAIVTGIGAGITIFIFFALVLSPLATVWFAPKLYLIETLSKVVK